MKRRTVATVFFTSVVMTASFLFLNFRSHIDQTAPFWCMNAFQVETLGLALEEKKVSLLTDAHQALKVAENHCRKAIEKQNILKATTHLFPNQVREISKLSTEEAMLEELFDLAQNPKKISPYRSPPEIFNLSPYIACAKGEKREVPQFFKEISPQIFSLIGHTSCADKTTSDDQSEKSAELAVVKMSASVMTQHKFPWNSLDMIKPVQIKDRLSLPISEAGLKFAEIFLREKTPLVLHLGVNKTFLKNQSGLISDVDMNLPIIGSTHVALIGWIPNQFVPERIIPSREGGYFVIQTFLGKEWGDQGFSLVSKEYLLKYGLGLWMLRVEMPHYLLKMDCKTFCQINTGSYTSFAAQAMSLGECQLNTKDRRDDLVKNLCAQHNEGAYKVKCHGRWGHGNLTHVMGVQTKTVFCQ